MSAHDPLIHAVSFAELVQAMFFMVLATGLILFFRPLLKGIVRALVLTVRPRPAKSRLSSRN